MSGNHDSRYEIFRSYLRTDTKNDLYEVTMRKCISIIIFEVVGSPLRMASGDGQKVYQRLVAVLQKDCKVALSFRNVTTLTAAFLNAAIGQLYGTFSEEQIRFLLKVEDMEPEDRGLLKRVVDTAKMYFKDPQRFDQVSSQDAGRRQG